MKISLKFLILFSVLILSISAVSAVDENSTVDTHISISDTSVEEGVGENFTGLLLDSSNNAVIGHHVALNLSRTSSGASKVYDIVSDYNGQFKIPIFLAKGDYTAQVSYGGVSVGGTVYNPSSAGPVSLTVVEVLGNRIGTNILVNDFTKVYGSDSNFTGLLIDANANILIGHHLSVKLSRASDGASKTYNVVTDYNGEFMIPINLLAGNYLADVSYPGTSVYKPSTAGTVNIIVTTENTDTNPVEDIKYSYNSTLLSEKLYINKNNLNYNIYSNTYLNSNS